MWTGLPTNAVPTILVFRDQCELLTLLIGSGARELEPENAFFGEDAAPTVGNHLARGLQDVR
jgi:hypothetical protein